MQVDGDAGYSEEKFCFCPLVTNGSSNITCLDHNELLRNSKAWKKISRQNVLGEGGEELDLDKETSATFLQKVHATGVVLPEAWLHMQKPELLALRKVGIVARGGQNCRKKTHATLP